MHKTCLQTFSEGTSRVCDRSLTLASICLLYVFYKILQKTALAALTATHTRARACTHAHITFIYFLFLQVEPGRYLILDSPLKSFEDNARDKFQKVIPENLSEGVNLERTFEDLHFATIVPRVTNKGDLDKRYTLGNENLVQYGCKPASAKAESSPATLQKQTTGSRGASATLNLEKSFIKTLVEQYHDNQEKLFPKSDETTLEFIKKIDEESKSVTEDYKRSAPETSMSADNTSLRNEIEICKELLVQRLTVHMIAENDLMTEKGYRKWRNHACVVGSFAVYYVSLQLLHKKKFGTFILRLD